ncbi:tyrosine--tRNA ligase [Candidatus Woesearchaeota archaeon]|nr:tyrosine--tRNA ligase [Candidatus Woesearchaeota archaeon]
MDIEKRLELIREVGEEIITVDELRQLLETKDHPVAYDGFEASGQVHIAQGVMRAINVNKMIKAGCRFKMLVADWHAWANNKLGGDLEKIRVCGDYLVEVWKASGMDLSGVQFVYASDIVNEKEYWKKVLQISRNATIQRITRTGEIMGRKESEMQQASMIIYSCMQAADIFQLEADICQLGMDQRKVNVLAREIGPKLGFWKPVIVSHHMLMGLSEPKTDVKDATERAVELKMSKSKPDTAIFMTDSEADIRRKIGKAYCPEKKVNENPILEYCRYIIFEKFDMLEISRPEKFGGDLTVEGYNELEKLYADGKVHPMDLKNAVAEKLNILIEPVRKHFSTNARAKGLLEQVRSFEITR